VSTSLIPVFYAAAMAVSGIGSLLLGRILDRAGIAVLIPLTIVTAAYPPLVFLGGFWPALMYGTAWVGGSIVIGALFDVSLTAVVAFCMVAEFASIPLILVVRRRMARSRELSCEPMAATTIRPGSAQRPSAGGCPAHSWPRSHRGPEKRHGDH
jgi:hypothetical protein